jgi:hypothetical protein
MSREQTMSSLRPGGPCRSETPSLTLLVSRVSVLEQLSF